jgi:hypothetical protein
VGARDCGCQRNVRGSWVEHRVQGGWYCLALVAQNIELEINHTEVKALQITVAHAFTLYHGMDGALLSASRYAFNSLSFWVHPLNRRFAV